MSSFSDYLENAVLNEIFGGTAFAAPATVYIALCTAAPTDASTGSTLTEANYTGYSRKGMTNNKTTWSTATTGTLSNAVAITFDPCTAGSSTVTHFAICDAASNGNMLAWAPVSIQKTISAGDTPSYAIGQLTVALA